MIKVTNPTVQAPNVQPKQEKVLCTECLGSGLVEAGYTAKREGLVKEGTPEIKLILACPKCDRRIPIVDGARKGESKCPKCNVPYTTVKVDDGKE